MPVANEISPASLQTAAQKGTEELRVLLESVEQGTADPRVERVGRVKRALLLLEQEKELQELSEAERGRIIEAGRVVLQNAIDTVTSELRTAAGEKLADLERQQKDFLEAKAKALEMEANLADLAQRAGMEIRELQLDIKNASIEKKIGLGIAGAAGAGIALAIWNKVWGSKENPGAVRRLGQLIVALGAGAISAIGLNAWLRSSPFANEVVDVAGNVGKGAVDQTVDTVKEGTDVVIAGKDLLISLANAEDHGGFFEVLKDKGYIFVAEGGEFVVKTATDGFTVPAKFGAKFLEWSQGNVSNGDLAYVYGEAGVAYVVTTTMWRAILRGELAFPSLKVAIARAAAWPVMLTRDSVVLGSQLATQEGRAVLHTVGNRWGPLRVVQRYRAQLALRGNTPAGIQSAIDHWRQLDTMHGVMDSHPETLRSGGFTQRDIAAIASERDALARRIQTAIRKANLEDAPEWMRGLKEYEGSRINVFQDKIGDAAPVRNVNAAVTEINDLEKLIASGNASIDDILRVSGATADDALAAGHSLEDVCRALTALDDADDALRTKNIAQLLINNTADDLVNAGADMGHVCKSINSLSDEYMRTMHIESFLENGKDAGTLYKAGLRPADILSAAPEAIDDLTRAGVQSSELLSTGNMRTAIRARLSQQYTDEALEMVDRAILRGTEAGLVDNVDDAVKLFGDHAVIKTLADGTDDILDALRVAATHEHGLEAVQSTARYIFGLGDTIPTNALSSQILEKVAGMHPNAGARLGAIVRRLPAVAQSPRSMNYLINQLDTLSRASLLSKSLYVVGGIAEIGAVIYDVMEYNAMVKKHAQVRNDVSTMLRGAKDSTGRSIFTVSGSEEKLVFTHRETELSIELSMFEQHHDSLEALQTVNIAASSAGALVTILAPSISMGPGGLVVAGAVLAVHGVTAIGEQYDKRKFLTDIPMPVLAMMGTGRIVDSDERDTVAAASNTLVTDLFYTDAESNKRHLRKKAMLTMFMQELTGLSQTHPEIVHEVMGNEDPYSFMLETNDLFREDYEKVIAPYVYARMFEDANDSDAKWSEFREGRIDEGWFDETNIDEPVMRRIMREAAFIYAQHQREGGYIQLQEEYRQWKVAQDNMWKQLPNLSTLEQVQLRAQMEQEDANWQQKISDFGGLTIFNQRLDALKLDEHESQTQKILAQARGTLDARSTGTRTRYTGGYHPGSFSVPSGTESFNRTRRQMVEGQRGLFNVELPEGLLPEQSERSVPLRNLYYLSLREQIPGVRATPEAEVLPEQREALYADVVDKTVKLISHLHEADYGWGPRDVEYRKIVQYGDFLAQHTEFDCVGVQEEIRQLPRRGWLIPGENWLFYANSDYYKEVLRPKFDSALAKIRENYSQIQARRNSFVPLNRSHERWRRYASSIDAIELALVDSNDGLENMTAENKRSMNLIRHWVDHLNLAISPDGSHYTREGYTGRYFTQSDGTVYWEGGTSPSGVEKGPHIFRFSGEGRQWKWYEATESDRKEGMNLYANETIYVVLPDGQEMAFRKTDATNARSPFPLPGGGRLVYRTNPNVPDLVEWKIEGAPAGHYYTYQKNFLGIEQQGTHIDVEDIPPRTFRVSTLEDTSKKMFFPNPGMQVRIVLRDGSVVEAGNFNTSDRNAFAPLREYLEIESGYKSDYAVTEWQNGEWVTLSPMSRVSGHDIRIKPEHFNDIDHVEFTNNPLTSRIPGETYVLNVGAEPQPQPTVVSQQERYASAYKLTPMEGMQGHYTREGEGWEGTFQILHDGSLLWEKENGETQEIQRHILFEKKWHTWEVLEGPDPSLTLTAPMMRATFYYKNGQTAEAVFDTTADWPKIEGVTIDQDYQSKWIVKPGADIRGIYVRNSVRQDGEWVPGERGKYFSFVRTESSSSPSDREAPDVLPMQTTETSGSTPVSIDILDMYRQKTVVDRRTIERNQEVTLANVDRFRISFTVPGEPSQEKDIVVIHPESIPEELSEYFAVSNTDGVWSLRLTDNRITKFTVEDRPVTVYDNSSMPPRIEFTVSEAVQQREAA
ncbi:hypothetical protein COU78_05905 [Candidatus Peregrinibacteria bacterium CG10_big_fil_rev_8_21_14_0_10_49_24]|nr:MAG: hypothetical protein COV83_04610 [Candidatus Peregrinibacteria bacterium CG11_big_fil_rev_8_21_14_0_20_49_14]PIR50555.1 MAG: hypothetical protein COU78_05905 [Candidatus Peregrinibacteria bacterium CG10_big_fil_rev_8_21_14_0_10_49_24]PJA67925.1 MAG: hypothetical protein CO157_02075 [Candidatus Peregrinibacteria bacterium CG_4_9_14_3_um_filter_49_12]